MVMTIKKQNNYSHEIDMRRIFSKTGMNNTFVQNNNVWHKKLSSPRWYAADAA